MTNLQTETTLTNAETKERLTSFFEDCKGFWTREKANNAKMYTEEINVTEMALKDIASLNNDPYSPRGKALDKDAQAEWLASQGYVKK